MTTTEDDDWLDDVILSDDVSQKFWARRALGGMSVNDAMMGVPHRGQLLAVTPIAVHRKIQDHIKASGRTQSEWLRQAVALKVAQEGGDPSIVEALS